MEITTTTNTIAIDNWVDRIRPHLTGAVEHILAAGRELIAAKEALPHGQFGPLLDELGLSRHMANRFMRVATNKVIAKCAPVHGLPAAVSVLDELAKLDDDRLAEAIETGEITASTTRKDAVQLVNHARDPFCSGRAPDVRAWWSDAEAFAREIVDEYSIDDPDALDTIRHHLVVEAAAKHFNGTAVLPSPAPPWWSSGEPFVTAVYTRMLDFALWCDAVGIDERWESDFRDAVVPFDEMLDRLDPVGLAAWEPESWWPQATMGDRRHAAVGHWFCFLARKVRPMAVGVPS